MLPVQSRHQWATFTRGKTGADAAIYLQINRGGYTVGDWYVAYFIGDVGTLSVAAHEGWHRVRRPPFRVAPAAVPGRGAGVHVRGGALGRGAPPAIGPAAAVEFSRNRSRMMGLRNAVEGSDLIPLTELASMHAGQVVDQPGEQIEAFYAESWAFAKFLWDGEGGRHRPALRRILTDAGQRHAVPRPQLPPDRRRPVGPGVGPAAAGALPRRRPGGGGRGIPEVRQPPGGQELSAGAVESERPGATNFEPVCRPDTIPPRTRSRRRSGKAVQRRTYYFSGQVQGVGFRYTTHHIARGHPVKGYVRNLPDGRVELVMEGEETDMDAVVASLKRKWTATSSKIDVSNGKPTGEFTDFPSATESIDAEPEP